MADFLSKLLKPQARKLASMASWLVLARGLEMLNSVVVSIWIARHLGPADYGVLSYALTVFALARPLVGFGLSNMVMRDIRLDPSQADAILGSTLLLRWLGTLIAASLVYGLVSLSSIDHPGFVWLCVTLILASLIAAPRGVEHYFIATGRPRIFVLANLVNILIFAAIKITLILSDAGVDAFVRAQAGEIAGMGVVALAAYARSGRDPRDWRPTRRWLVNYLRRGRVLMFGGFALIVATKIDVVLVAEIAGKAEAGIYAAAARISTMIYNVPVAFAAAVFPFLIDLEKKNRPRYEETLQLVLDGLAAAALFAAISMTFLAKPLIGFLLGEKFLPSADILVIHVWVCLFIFTRAIVDNWLISREYDALQVRVHVAGVALNVGLNLLLIPHFGAIGAAYAVLLSFASATLIVLGTDARGRPILRMVIKAITTWPLRLPLLLRRVLGQGFGGMAT